MGTARSENRDKAFIIYIENNGNITNRAIAKTLDISEKTVGGWKCKDKWVEKLSGVPKSNKKSTPLKNKKSTPTTKNKKSTPKKKQGKPKKNKRGAPIGNKNAVGYGGPPGNKKALVTGEFEAIWLDTLDTDEQGLYYQIDLDPVKQIEHEIQLLTIRERRMLKRIQDLKNGLTDKQIKILKERQAVKSAIPIHDESTGQSKTVIGTKHELVVVKTEETEYRVILDILRIEEALTRVQDKKMKAIKVLHDLDDAGERKVRVEKLIQDIKLDRERFEHTKAMDRMKVY